MSKENKISKIKLGLNFFWFYLLLGVFFSLAIFGFFFYRSHKIVEMEVASNEADFYTPIVVDFSSPMLKETVEAGLKVSPEIDYSLFWQGDQRIFIKFAQYPMPGVTYNFELIGTKNRYLSDQRPLYFEVKIAEEPKIGRFYPDKGQENVATDAKIELFFDKNIDNDYEIFFEINPKIDSLEYKLEENHLIVYPKNGFEKDGIYRYKAILKNKKMLNYEKTLVEAEFLTEKTKPVVYNFDSEEKPLKTEVRLEEYEPQIKEGKLLQVDLSSQTLVLYENGQEVALFKVSSGMRGMDTPVGQFKVMSKSRRPWSAKYELYMPYFIQFTNQGHGFHELPEWPGGYKEGENHLGLPVSHGCVRLGVGPANVVYNFAEVGTPIVIQQ